MFKTETRPELAGLFKIVLQPRIETFNECFKPGSKRSWTLTNEKGDDWTVSSFCVLKKKGNGGHGYTHRHLEPEPWMLDMIREEMIPMENDSIYFEIIDHGKFAYVLAKYNVIIGSRALAYIKSDTVPWDEEKGE